MGNSLIENPLAEVADLEGNIYDGNLDTKGITSLVCHHQIIEEVRQQIRLAGKITVTTCLPRGVISINSVI